MSHQEKIIELYFNKKYKQTEIAKELDVSNAYITKMKLSGRHSISNRAYRNWNSSAYKYNNKTKTYNLK